MTLSIRNAGKAFLQKFYTPRKFLWRLPASQACVALTFDDGPDPVYTKAVLDLLALHGIKATFFVIGEKAEKHPDLVLRMVVEGHAVASHSWSHKEIVGQSRNELAADLGRCRELLRVVGGVETNLFRPPRGRVDLASIRHVCSLGYCLVHWTNTYGDYQRDGADRLIARFQSKPPVARDIVLLHDHNADTVAALNVMIPEWKAEGLKFAKISIANL